MFYIYFIIYLSVLGFSHLVFVFVLLIYLGVGPSNGRCPKSKATLSTGTLVLLLSSIPILPTSSLTKRLNYWSIDQLLPLDQSVWPGARHHGWMFLRWCDQLQSEGNWSPLAVISSSHSLHFIYLSSFRAIRQWDQETRAVTGKPDVWGLN